MISKKSIHSSYSFERICHEIEILNFLSKIENKSSNQQNNEKSILSSSSHDHKSYIVKLKDVILSSSHLFLIFERFHLDLFDISSSFPNMFTSSSHFNYSSNLSSNLSSNILSSNISSSNSTSSTTNSSTNSSSHHHFNEITYQLRSSTIFHLLSSISFIHSHHLCHLGYYLKNDEMKKR